MNNWFLPCTRAAGVGALLLSPAVAPGQSRTDAEAVQAARQAIFEAEDRRAPAEADVATLRNGLVHPDEAVQRMAVRALGRLERPALVADIEPALSSASARVRTAAAEALGQAASAGGGDAAAWLRDPGALMRLAKDGRDNVREAAIGGLKTVAGHEADDLYIEALGRRDYQLVMTAANALIGTPRRAEAPPASRRGGATRATRRSGSTSSTIPGSITTTRSSGGRSPARRCSTASSSATSSSASRSRKAGGDDPVPRRPARGRRALPAARLPRTIPVKAMTD